MKKLLLSAFALCFAGTIAAQEAPLWMRYCALSPDGTTIAFTYKGDIYTVPSTGGRATQITTNPAFDTTPVWSPDGTKQAVRNPLPSQSPQNDVRSVLRLRRSSRR